MRRSEGNITFFNKIKYWDKYLPIKLKSDLLIITKDGSISKNDLIKLKPKSKKVKLWYNGYDLMVPKNLDIIQRRSRFTLISVSHLTNWKNIDKKIEILNIAIKKGYQWDLIIIGHGNELNRLKRLVNEYSLDNHVTFTGQLSRKEILSYLKSSDVFLNLYDRQNLSNTLWEAMSMGKCIITRKDLEINREIINHGENGFLFSIVFIVFHILGMLLLGVFHNGFELLNNRINVAGLFLLDFFLYFEHGT